MHIILNFVNMFVAFLPPHSRKVTTPVEFTPLSRLPIPESTADETSAARENSEKWPLHNGIPVE